MENQQAPEFSTLLRRFRLTAGLSQEALASLAGLSAVSISALERGTRRAPHRHTITLLADALQLPSPDRALLESAGVFPARPRDRAPRAAPAVDEQQRRDTLPLALTSFHGRERDIDELCEALRERRLVTLCGVGGVGKTRLAVETARRLRSHFADGALLVEMAAVLNPEQVITRIAILVNVQDRPGRLLMDTLTLALRDRQLLLVLDNCEHVLDVVANATKRLLEDCSQLRVLATSREPLRVPGERVHSVTPLGLPESVTAPLPSLDELRQSPAIRLFFDRATDVTSTLTVEGDKECRSLVGICKRLDGLPLAIELAAARMNTLTLSALEAQLDDRFNLLTRGERTAPARHQTLRATLDWSYALLAGPERITFRRLGIFVGGWTLEAAQAVCADGQTVPCSDVLDLLGSLVEKSLIVADTSTTDPRYRLLETMRAYALERLAESNELQSLARVHLAYFCQFAQQAHGTFGAVPIQQWLPPLRMDIDNIRAALRWAFGDGNAPGDGIALVATLGWTFGRLGFYAEGQRRCEHALDLLAIRNDRDPRLEAHLQLAMMIYHYFEGVDAGEEALERSSAAGTRATDLYRRLDDRKSLAYALPWLGQIYALLGRSEEGDKIANEGIAFARTLGDRFRLSFGLCWKSLTIERGDFEARRALLHQALDIANAISDDVAIAISSHLLGLLASEIGESASARVYLERGIAYYERAGNFASVVGASGVLAWCALVEGDVEATRANARKAIVLRQQLQGGETTMPALVSIAGITILEGQPCTGALLLGAAQRIHERLHHWKTLFDGKPVYDLALELLRSALPEHELQALMREGASWTIERTLAEALRV